MTARLQKLLLAIALLPAMLGSSVLAAEETAPEALEIRACTLISKKEIKIILDRDIATYTFDREKEGPNPREAYGSTCKYALAAVESAETQNLTVVLSQFETADHAEGMFSLHLGQLERSADEKVERLEGIGDQAFTTTTPKSKRIGVLLGKSVVILSTKLENENISSNFQDLVKLALLQLM